MPSIQEPLLAQDYNPIAHRNHFPFFGTPKVDGMRFYMDNSTVWSRSNKPFPNNQLQFALQESLLPDGVDGELMMGHFGDPEHFQRCQETFRAEAASIHGATIFLFDYLAPEATVIKPYNERIQDLRRLYHRLRLDTPHHFTGRNGGFTIHFELLYPFILRTPDSVEKFLGMSLEQGYEGIILRKPTGGYKFGRPSADEALMLRYKPLADSEATIINFMELEHNDNPPTISPTGKTVRSSAKANKRGGNTLGSFVVSDPRFTETFKVGNGTGLDDRLRRQVWTNRETYLGRRIRYAYLESGTKDRPRMPKFTGFREDLDVS